MLLASITLNAQNKKVESPKIAIKVDLGKSIVLNDVTLKFIDVVEDSRCPKYTNCIWAGRAIVLVEVTEEGNTTEKKIYIGETRNNEPTSKMLYLKEDYFIEVVNLNPYPEEGKEKSPYTLLVCESK